MNTCLPLICLLFLTIFCGIHGQWYIIKKDNPQKSMNYPNPGKRSLPEDETQYAMNCAIPYSQLTTYDEKTAWLLFCKKQQSPSILVDSTSTSSSSSSSSGSSEDEMNYSPRLIPHDRRTLRSIPPYFNEQRDVFHIRLLKRLRRSTRK